MNRLLLLFTVIVCLGIGQADAQEVVRNFGFEQIDSRENIIGWELWNGNGKYVMGLDTAVVRTGQCSFRMELADSLSDKGQAGATMKIIIPNIDTKREVSVSAFIRTEDLHNNGGAVIVAQLGGQKGVISEHNSVNQNKTGTTDWTRHRLELLVTPDVQYIRVGLMMSGVGKVWFDDFELRVDGIPLDGTDLTAP